jgi:predicted nucleic-acid-binding protein
MLAVDTNVLVRLLARDDVKQAAAADAAIAKGAWVSQLVLAEAVWVLDAVYERTPKQLIAALDLLLTHESLVLQDADVVAAAVAQFRAKPKLGFSDCLVLEIARKAGHLPLATFDKTLGQVAGTITVTRLSD